MQLKKYRGKLLKDIFLIKYKIGFFKKMVKLFSLLKILHLNYIGAILITEVLKKKEGLWC